MRTPRSWKIVAYLFILFFTLLALFPFIWMILSSFKSASEYIAQPPTLLPSVWHVENYSEVLEIAPFGLYFKNSLIVATITMVVATITSFAMALIFAFSNFKHKEKLFWLLMFLLVVPDELNMITNYQTISSLGLINTKIAICLPYLVNVMFIYLLRIAFEKIPKEIISAALIDGMSLWRFIFMVVIPYSKQSITAMALIVFINAWNAFLWPFLVTTSIENRVITNGIVAFTQEGGLNPQYQVVGATLAVIPIVIIFIFFSKKIMNSFVVDIDEVNE